MDISTSSYAASYIPLQGQIPPSEERQRARQTKLDIEQIDKKNNEIDTSRIQEVTKSETKNFTQNLSEKKFNSHQISSQMIAQLAEV